MAIRASTFVIVAELSDGRNALLAHGITGALDKVPVEVGLALKAARGKPILNGLLDDDTTAHLLKRGHITSLSFEAEGELLRAAAASLRARGIQNKVPSVSFVPTYQCNLRCFYCFQPHRAHAGQGKFSAILTDEQVSNAFSIIDQFAFPGSISSELESKSASPGVIRPEHPRYGDIGLFGGEPLSARTLSVVKTISKHAAKRGVNLWAISNGTELDRFAGLLGTEAGQINEVQITLDGTAESHNKRRRGPSLPSTFSDITENIELCLSRGVLINVRMNTDAEISAQIAPLAEYFEKRRWSEKPHFSFNCAVVTSPTAPPSPDWGELVDLTTSAQESGHRVTSYEHFARDFLTNCLEARTGDIPHKKTANCAAEEGQLMFDCMGDVYGCWEDVGFVQHRIGTFDSAGLRLDRSTVLQWFARHPGTLGECQQCPYALIHTSGCGAQARERTGTIANNDCAGFQSYFPRSLAREYENFEKAVLQASSREKADA